MPVAETITVPIEADVRPILAMLDIVIEEMTAARERIKTRTAELNDQPMAHWTRLTNA